MLQGWAQMVVYYNYYLPENFVFVNTKQNSGNGTDGPFDVSVFSKCTLKNHPHEK